MLANSEGKCRNSKLETFLKRKLKSGVYDDIRWYEPVFLRREGSLAHKQVVVTGESVLLVDTAPYRDITTLLQFDDITAVLMGHDLPEFLEGDLRDRTTHILLKVQGRARPGARPREQEDNKVLRRRRRRRRRRSSLSTADVAPIMIRGRGLTVNGDMEGKARRLSDLMECPSQLPRHFEDISEEGLREKSMSTPLLCMSKDFATRSISPALWDVLNRAETKYSIRGRCSSTSEATERRPFSRSISASDHYLHHGPPVSVALRSRSALDTHLNFDSNTFPRRRRSRSISNGEVNKLLEEEEEEEIHLYTLSTSTHLFHLLHSLWVASLLDVISRKSSLQINEEGIDLTYKSLCNDLRDATSLEDHCSLLKDLQEGLKKYSSVRRFFWKNTEALAVVRRLLRRYRRHKSLNLLLSNDTYEDTENELEIGILVLQIIESSLAHSQGCPFKDRILRSTSLLEKLFKDVFTIPKIPAPHNLMCNRFLTSFKELSEGTWELLPEKKLLENVQKTIHTSVGAAFYLINAINELGWNYSFQGEPNIRKKEQEINILNDISLDEWMSYAIPQLLLLIQLISRDTKITILGKESNVLVYKYLSVLVVLLKQCPKCLSFCVTNYSEEIRYYLNESVLKRQFDPLNPLTSHVFALTKAVSKLVLR